MSARTKVSNWVYLLACALMIAATVYFLRNILKVADQLVARELYAQNGHLLPVQFILQSSPLILATIALLLRSGAVFWLITGFCFSQLGGMLIPFLGEGEFFGMVILGTVCLSLVITLSILFWLVKKEEIRRP